jgi:hypothetical protein
MYSKISLLSAFLFIVGTSAIAQPEQNTFSITPRIGISATNMMDDAALEIPFGYVLRAASEDYTPAVTNFFETGLSKKPLYNTKYRMAFAGNVDIQWHRSRLWAFVTGVGYAFKGCKYDTDEYNPLIPNTNTVSMQWDVKDVRLNLHYFTLPTIAKLYIGQGFALNAGAQIEWLIRSNYRSRLGYSTSVPGEYYIGLIDDAWRVRIDAEKVYEEDVKIKTSKLFHRFDISFPVGFSYEYGHYVTDLRANLGWADIGDGHGHCRNIGFTLSFGYRFDFKLKEDYVYKFYDK